MDMVSARSAKSWLAASRMNTSGRNTMTAVTVDASSAGHTCFDAASVASRVVMPCARLLRVASSIDDRGIECLAHTEREPCERNHVECAARQFQRDERDEQADRNRKADEQRRAPVAHEIPEREHCEHARPTSRLPVTRSIA